MSKRALVAGLVLVLLIASAVTLRALVNFWMLYLVLLLIALGQ